MIKTPSGSSFHRLLRPISGGFTVAIALLVLWHLYAFPSTNTHLVAAPKDVPERKPHLAKPSKRVIPNLVHFVYMLKDPESELAFDFSAFLSVYAAWHYWHPDAIYLHTDAPNQTISRARDGLSGKWSKLLFSMPGFQVKHATSPTHAGNGAEINLMEHKSDFVRVQAVREFGGTYIDFDAHALRDIKVLREAGFNAIGGRQLGGQVMSGTIMSRKGSKMINLWAEEMPRVYDGGWVTHSNEVITRVGEKLVAEPGEMLIMEREAFGPGSWEAEDLTRLYEPHMDTPSSLEGIDPGGRLPSYGADSPGTGNYSESTPSWATNWSRTYILHAFGTKRSGTKVEGFDHISPRYVLERRSNFARAVYPIAKILYDRGLIDVNDL
ncbi:hypothetical protein J3458_013230 [Metarhizium acridum]|uniref:uncharacterized protein n=1 Tax=Metarhizium acridum TaxID=92637 RepID=UPI001C6B851E|nr:hypothetical protein J3458_013230 [Metarhizium acridum]